MADINDYANNLLIDFSDALHAELKRILQVAYGSNWIARGVRKHFHADQFTRVEAMLQNPLRVVDMNKTQEDFHGLEHFWNIINGNWRLFQPFFQDKQRTEVYLGEITELRHNLAHRRRSHVLLKGDLVRIVGNCAKCLFSPGFGILCAIPRECGLLDIRSDFLGIPTFRPITAKRGTVCRVRGTPKRTQFIVSVARFRSSASTGMGLWWSGKERTSVSIRTGRT